MGPAFQELSISSWKAGVSDLGLKQGTRDWHFLLCGSLRVMSAWDAVDSGLPASWAYCDIISLPLARSRPVRERHTEGRAPLLEQQAYSDPNKR